MVSKKLSLLQCILLIVVSRITTIYIYLPTLSAPPFNQDIWIAEILSIPYTVIVCLPLMILSCKHSNLTLIEVMEKYLGRILGKIMGITYVGFLMFICITLCCHLIQFMGSTIMPETPSKIIIIFLMVAVTYTIYKDIDTLGMISEIFVPFILFVIVIFLFLNYKNMDFKIFSPMLVESKLKDINIGALNNAFRFYDIIVIAMFVPYIKEENGAKKVFFYYLAICSLLLIIITMSTQAVLGIQLARRSRFPYYLYARQIDLFDFIQRIEVVNVIGWFLTVLIKFSVYMYAATLSMKQIFNTKSYKTFVIPSMVVIFIIVFKTEITKAINFEKIISYKVFPYISAVFMLVIPFITFIAYLVRSRRG